MRLFTGIALPRDVIGELTKLLDRLRPEAHVKWSLPWNLHVTTKFIGQWPDNRLEELISTLQPLSTPGPIDISISGTGWFPNASSPRVLFAGVHAGADLAKLAVATQDALAGIGVERDSKPFSPHLTLARIPDAAQLTLLRRALANLQSKEFGSFTADRFHLYQSRSGPAGSIYTQLAEFPFSK